MPPMLGGTSIRRSLTALISALAMFALTLVGAGPSATTSSAATTSTVTRTATVSTKAIAYTDRKSPKSSYLNKSESKIQLNRFNTYVAFPKISLPSGSHVSKITVTMTVTRTNSPVAGAINVRPVTSGWTGGKLTYKKSPHVGATIAYPAIAKSRGAVAITLNTSGTARYLAKGLKIRMTRHGSASTMKIAKKVYLRVTYTRTVTVGTDSSTTAPVGHTITDKPVFAHYFPPYPISLENYPASRDYYTVNYLQASGEGGKFASTGGLLRDRPLPRDPISGDWEFVDMGNEINHAKAAGVTGFAVDLLTTNTSDQLWRRTTSMLRAADADGNFSIMLQPDMWGIGSITPAQFAKAMATLSSYKSTYRLKTGQVVISPFLAEAKTPAWYSEALGIMKSQYGVSATLLPLFLNASYMKQYASISIGFGHWGERDAVVINQSGNGAADAHALGKVWMEPVSVQDERPRDAVYDEAWNTSTLRASWTKAINQNADMVLLTTWNDYSECSSWAPSTDHGTAFLNIGKHYLTKFRTGSYATPSHDSVYIVHRIQKYSTMPTTYTKVMKRHYPTGGSASRDKVEIVTVLKASSEVTVVIGGVTYKYTAPAGLATELFNLAEGKFTATVNRSGDTVATVTTKDAVKFTTEQQDLSYHAVGSD